MQTQSTEAASTVVVEASETVALPVEPLRRDWRRGLMRAAFVLVILDLALFAALYGINLRRAVWFNTSGVHFLGDVRNAYKWGMLADRVGVLNLYDYVQTNGMQSPHSGLDYTPLRLTAAWTWARWAKIHYPDVAVWRDDYDLTRPMLMRNTMAEGASAILVFLLIRLWSVRMDEGRRREWEPRPMLRGWVPGLIGALLFWFNPAVIWDGHCWPQWDVWLMPFFLAAVLLASLDWWFTAGMMLMVGAALKGQILMAAPVLVIWPIFSLRFGAVLRLACGFAFAAAVIAFPWLKMDARPIVWCAMVMFAMALLVPLTWRMKLWWPWIVSGAVLAMVVAWPWASTFTRVGDHAEDAIPTVGWRSGALIIVAVIGLARFLPRRLVPAIYAGALAAAVLLTMPLFGADDAWYQVGFKFGTEKFDDMIAGTGMPNIAAMQEKYLPEMGLTAYSQPSDPVELPWINKTVEYRTAASIASGICMVICGAGAALHARKRKPDTRFLMAMVAPWVCSVMFLTQMHGRYFVWAAGFTALLAGVGVGATLLGVIVTMIGWMAIVHNQYVFSRDYDPDLLQKIVALHPHVGWVMLVIMLVFLYTAVMPRSRYT